MKENTKKKKRRTSRKKRTSKKKGKGEEITKRGKKIIDFLTNEEAMYHQLSDNGDDRNATIKYLSSMKK